MGVTGSRGEVGKRKAAVVAEGASSMLCLLLRRLVWDTVRVRRWGRLSVRGGVTGRAAYPSGRAGLSSSRGKI